MGQAEEIAVPSEEVADKRAAGDALGPRPIEPRAEDRRDGEKDDGGKNKARKDDEEL